MFCVRIRFIHTEAFRLSAIYAGVFALSVLVLGSLVLVITDRAFRDQITQFSSANIAAIQSGYKGGGVREAQEVIAQSMAALSISDYFLLQQDRKKIAG